MVYDLCLKYFSVWFILNEMQGQNNLFLFSLVLIKFVNIRFVCTVRISGHIGIAKLQGYSGRYVN